VVIRQRPNDGDLAAAGIEREQVPLVLEQHHRLMGDLQGLFPKGRLQDDLGMQRLVRIGLLEQPQGELESQDPPHGCIDDLHRHSAVAHELSQVRRVGTCHHVHLYACRGGLECGFPQISRDAVRDQLADRVIVAHHHAIPAPLFAQDGAQGKGVSAGRHATQVIERRHGGAGALFKGRTEGRQVHIAQGALGHVRGVIVLAGLGGAVGHIVLGAGDDLFAARQPLGLESAHPGAGHRRPQEGILAAALGDASPARIAADVHHGGKDPVDA